MSWQQPSTLLKHSQYQLGVVAGSQDVFERCVFILLKPILGDIGVFGQSILACLDESLLLLSGRLKGIRQLPWWEIPGFLGLFWSWGFLSLLTALCGRLSAFYGAFG